MPAQFGKPFVLLARKLKAKRAFRLFRFGDNPSTKGTYKLTPDAAAAVMSTYKARGLKITFDYDHHALKKIQDARPDDGVAAGKCDLELRDDGIWCVNVEWTPKALKAIEDGEWVYFSPAFIPDEETKEILEVMNVALTNIPALDGIEPLAANRKTGEEPAKLTTTTAAPPPKKEERTVHPIAEHLKKFVSGGKSLADCAKASGIHADRMKELHDGAGAEPSQEEMKALGKAMSLSQEQLKAMGVPAPTESTETASAMDGQDVDKVEGDGDDDEDDVIKKSKRDSGAAEMLTLLTGTSDPVKQRAKVKAMSERARAYDEDHEEIKLIKAERMAERREQLIAKGKLDGKLNPKLIKYWSNRPVDELEEYLKHAPVILNVRAAVESETGDDAVQLTREEQEVARICHVTPEDFAKAKKLAGGLTPGAPADEHLSEENRQRITLLSNYQKAADQEFTGAIADKKALLLRR